MRFAIASSFQDALARLPRDEQKAAKISAMDLQMNPASTGLQLHRIDNSRDRNLWSVRVNRDLRIVVHRTSDSMALVYVDRHDKAYQWAERRRIEVHPKTGVMQIVPIRDHAGELAPRLPFEAGRAGQPEAPASAATIPCFKHLTGEQLLSVGVPPDWVSDVLAADEDRFLAIADQLPAEASEALLEYAATGSLPVPKPALPHKPFDHPDALRRFRFVENADELRQALEEPWEKWLVYLHPSQRDIIEKDFTGPARVAGTAGTGKTIVAIHRAARLARDADARVLLTTFSQPLSNLLQHKMDILLGANPSVLARVTISPFHGIAGQIYELAFGRRPHIAAPELLGSMLRTAAAELDAKDIPPRFLISEWSNVIDAWQVATEENYATVPRLGRKNRLGAKQRARLWPVFARVRDRLAQTGVTTWAQVCADLVARYSRAAIKPFTNIVVDEAQDLGVPELRLLAALAPHGANGLFFAGDLGQRIFQQPFSWLALGVDVRGRSQRLKVNYRTSHQIRQAADRLLPKMIRDVDGTEERRTGTVSVFNGPEPQIEIFKSAEGETMALGTWIGRALADGMAPSEIGVFVRDHVQLDRARAAAREAGMDVLVLSERGEDVGGRIRIGTMHLAKGLEFKAVAVMACDDEVLPLKGRIEAAGDEVDLDDVYETERQLLYVACTRARDRLFVSGVAPASEFLADFGVPR